MLALSFAATAFTPPASRCSTPATLGRRELFQGAGAALAAVPLAAFADGANSRATAERARAIYGSRVYRLQTASAATIADEAAVLQLFITGSYRGADSKPTAAALKKLSKSIVASAKAGDESAAKAGLKEFVALGKITELDSVAGGNFNPKQRRNPGAPPTSEIEAQMGTEAFALYAPLKTMSSKPTI